jgi:hypothetical protein
VSPDLLAERPGRARPVADAPVDELVGQADELARRWALSLLAARALAQMDGVPLQQLAREAPALCAQLSRALRSDAELAQLLESPDASERGPAERSVAPWAWIAPEGDAAAAVHDVEALRGVLWAAALDELRDPPANQVAELADRLAYVCASLLATVLARRETPSAGAGLIAPSSPPRAGQILYSSPSVPSVPSGRRAVLIDEVAEATSEHSRAGATPLQTPPRDTGAGAPRRADAHAEGPAVASPAQRTGSHQATPRARPWDTPLNAAATEEQPRRQDSAPWPAVPEPRGGPAAVRVTRGPGSPVDERV